MKIRELLNEATEQAVMIWLKKHVNFVVNSDTGHFIEFDNVSRHLDDEDDKHSAIAYSDGHLSLHQIDKIYFNFTHTKVSACPIKSTEWDDTQQAFVHTVGLNNAIVDTFEFMPVSRNVEFNKCTIETLKTNKAEVYDHIETMRFNVTEIKCGILSLLKFNRLESIVALYDDEDGPENRALNIVKKYLKTGRNIPECQQELIEEGLQEFAKL